MWAVLAFKAPQEEEMGSDQVQHHWMTERATERTGKMNERTEQTLFNKILDEEIKGDVVEIPISLTQYLEAGESKHFDFSDEQILDEVDKKVVEGLREAGMEDRVGAYMKWVRDTRARRAEEDRIQLQHEQGNHEGCDECMKMSQTHAPATVKTIKDVIQELLVIMSEVGNVDVAIAEDDHVTIKNVPHIEYDATMDRVIIQ